MEIRPCCGKSDNINSSSKPKPKPVPTPKPPIVIKGGKGK